jgi:hypothetical protein
VWPGFILDQRAETGVAIGPTGQVPDRQATETPTNHPVAVPSAATPPATPGGGVGAAPPAPAGSGSFLVLADGRRIEVPPSGEVTLPPDATGEVSLFVPGRVPSTVVLTGPVLPTALHPRTDSPPGAPTTTGTVRGTLAAGGLSVAYMGPEQSAFTGATTIAGGGFSFEVPTEGPQTGILIVREPDGASGLALRRVSVAPDQITDMPPLALDVPIDVHSPAPTPPAGMRLMSAALKVAAGSAARPFVATVLSVDGDRELPAYDLPGFDQALAYEAGAPDGLSGASTAGPPGRVPAFLDAPALGGLPSQLTPGARLSWPGVTGAALYTVWLADAATPAVPLWEAATGSSAVTIPSGLALADRELVLQVTAWDAPEVTLYSVASARQLRVPTGVPGLTGRHSRALRHYSP